MFVAGIMVSSVFGVIFFGFNSAEQKVGYNGYSFTRKQDQWMARLDKQAYYFHYLPTEVESIDLASGVIVTLSNRVQVDLTSDINDTSNETISATMYYLAQEIAREDVYLRAGFTTNTIYDLPVISCEDATLSVPVIYVLSSNITSIEREGDCVKVKAKSDIDFLRAKDRLLYSLLGIMG